ncbi:MAG TPA: S8 family serine peptidase, partial [Longimicrobium sp.]
ADQAVQSLLDAGVLLVAAAGNNNTDACNISPAWKPGVLTVAATDANDVRYSGSNWGACVDIYAPGVNILSAGIGGDWATSTRTGTSLAAPHVTGAVARFLQSRPGAKPDDAHAFAVTNATSNVVVSPGYLTPNRLLWVDPAARRLTLGPIQVQQGTNGKSHKAEVLDGMGGYQYTWYVNGVYQTSGTSDTFDYASIDDYEVTVTVTDAAAATESTELYVAGGGGCSGGGSLDGGRYYYQQEMMATESVC